MNHPADSLKKNLVEISMKPLKNKKGWLLSHTRATCAGTNQPNLGTVVFRVFAPTFERWML
jgi:hypothetical protein